MGKSATKRNKKVDQNKENITAQKQTTPKFQKSTAFKNVNERDEDDNTSWRISNILPDINWYPEKSKSVKNEIGCDLMARYPLSVKAMTFMLQNDIKIPKLNTLQRRSLFRYPSSEEKEVIMKQFPNFKSGRFNEEENEVIIRNLKEYFEDVQFSGDEQKAFISELESFPSCHGGARGPTSNNLVYIKLYLACHVAGENLLAYRLSYDIYTTIISLWYSQFDPTLKPINIKKENITDESKNDSNANIGEKEKDKSEKKGNASMNDGVRGRFQTKDSCELINCIVTQLHSKRHPIEIDQLNIADIDWKEIEKQTFRTTKSMQRHFGLVIWPLLKEGPYIDQEDKTWQTDLMKIIIEKKVVFIQDIDWKNIQKVHFPNNSTIQLRTFISNTLKKGLERMAQDEKKVPIYKMLHPVFERYINFKTSAKPNDSFILKQNEITTFYENLIHTLLYSSKEKTATPKAEASEGKVTENNNTGAKRKINQTEVVSNSKKAKRSKRSLYTEKSAGPRTLTPHH